MRVPRRPHTTSRVPTLTILRAALTSQEAGCGSVSARSLIAGRRVRSVVRHTKLAARIPARKAPAVGDSKSNLVVQRQIDHRTTDIPVRGILVAGLAVAARKVILDLRLPPHRPT